MRIPRSTDYDMPISRLDDTAIVETMVAISDEFEHYGWRCVQAASDSRTWPQPQEIKRLMRDHDLQPKERRRHMATTDSVHDKGE